MKQVIFSFFLIVACLSSVAQTNVIVTYTDATTETFTVPSSGKIYFSENNLLIESENLNPTSIDMNTIQKLKFEAVKMSLAKSLASGDVYVFPNPADEVITIQGLDESTDIKIYSSLGKLVLTQLYEPSEFIQVANLPAGLYNICFNNQHITFIKR